MSGEDVSIMNTLDDFVCSKCGSSDYESKIIGQFYKQFGYHCNICDKDYTLNSIILKKEYLSLQRRNKLNKII